MVGAKVGGGWKHSGDFLCWKGMFVGYIPKKHQAMLKADISILDICIIMCGVSISMKKD